MNASYKVPVFLAITAPCATTIMAIDWFLLPQWFGISRRLTTIPSWRQAALANWPAITSLLVAAAYGATASAILPATLSFATARNWGPIPLESWHLAGVLYIAFATAAPQPEPRSRTRLPGRCDPGCQWSQPTRVSPGSIDAKQQLPFLAAAKARLISPGRSRRPVRGSPTR
jgi:hypothetical protein